jgi:hypothetical protein
MWVINLSYVINSALEQFLFWKEYKHFFHFIIKKNERGRGERVILNCRLLYMNITEEAINII